MFRTREGGSAPGGCGSLVSLLRRDGGNAEALTYLSDAVARVIVSGLASALLITPTTTTARSAAVPVLFVSRRISLAASPNKLQAWAKLGEIGEDTYRPLLGKNLVKTAIHACCRNRMTVSVLSTNARENVKE